MKRISCVVMVVLVLIAAMNVEAQISRKSQIEVFLGSAIPLSPDTFKDYYKVGGSLHGQYVMFPSPKMGIVFGLAFEGFTFDGDAFKQDFSSSTGYDLSGVDVEGTAGLMELGIGIRPYLSPQESSTQVFLLGMATFNSISNEVTVSFAGQSEKVTDDQNKLGIALGGGFELPAGDRFNLIIQGLTRFIFTSKDENASDEGGTTSFIGITVGLVF